MTEDYSRLVNDSFRSADQENKGFLTEEDYKVAIIQLLGYKPSKHELSQIWSETVGAEKGLALKEFRSIVFPRVSRRDSSEHIRQIFLAFDRFCHGFISQDDCLAAFVKVQAVFIIAYFTTTCLDDAICIANCINKLL